MQLGNSLSEFYEKNGYSCPICNDVYDLKEQDKKPVLLSCAQHSICLECIRQHGAQMRTCPVCRANIVYTPNPMPNSLLLNMMEMAKNMFETMKKAQGETHSNAPAPKPAPMEISRPPMPVPEKFELVTFTKERWNHVSVCDQILNIMPTVVQAMGWNNDAKELQKDFDPMSKQWVLFLENGVAKGFSWLKPMGSGHFEIHWTGITERSQETYYKFWKLLFNKVKAERRVADKDDWRNYSLTCYFNYDNPEELKQFERIQAQLKPFNVRINHTGIERNWGKEILSLQIKFQAFCFQRPGHEIRDLPKDENLSIAQDVSFEDKLKPQIDDLLDNSQGKLGFVFNMMYPNASSRQSWNPQLGRYETSPEYLELESIKNRFRANPETFFVYKLDGRVRGFIDFTVQGSAISVRNCRLLPDAQKFAGHFVEQFCKWAMAKESESIKAGVSATHIAWPNLNSYIRPIQDAISANADF